MTRDESIIELGSWLKTPPGRYLLAWEQDRLDHAVTDAFGFHALQGDRAGEFAMTVTRDYRLTFTKVDDQTISALDLEDCH